MKSLRIQDIEHQRQLQDVIDHFLSDTVIDDMFIVNSGHINDTFRVHVTNHEGSKTYILQKINTYVFREPDKLMENMVRVTSHIAGKLKEKGMSTRRRVIHLRPKRDGTFCYHNREGEAWRLMDFIGDTHAYDMAQHPGHAYEASKAFGKFQELLSDLSEPDLHITIPDFHNTPVRFIQLEDAIEKNIAGRLQSCRPEVDFAYARRDITPVLTDCIENGTMKNRPTHNDTKINNVLIDKNSGEGICVIDLDTVMPGLPLYDFGDCVRSTTRSGAEDEIDLDEIDMDITLFEAITRGYLESAGNLLSDLEKEKLAFSAKLITFETGIRFLADYLNGDVYYKTSRPAHNLDRARVHFKMIQSMEQQEEQMNAIVARYSNA
jgi:hypothetical protein